MTDIAEEWRVIADWPDYAISNLGRVKRLTTRTCAKAGTILKQCWRGGRGSEPGYLAVDLSRPGVKKRTVSVHVLVADAFLPPRPEGHVPNHLDGVRVNNRSDNLEWVTRARNVQHAYDIGLSDAKGQRNGQAKLREADVIEIRRMATGRRGECVTIADRFGISARQVSDIIKGKAWAHLSGATS